MNGATPPRSSCRWARWRANLEYTGGFARNTIQTASSDTADYFYLAYSYGQPFGTLLALDPLGNWNEFVTALNSYRRTIYSYGRQTSRLNDGTLRIAGPLFDLPGGEATLTLLAEDRRERVGASTYTLFDRGSLNIAINLPRIKQSTRSLSSELRLPVSGDDGVLRNFEMQLALRRDDARTTLPATATLFDADPPPFENRNTALAYTVGARFRPVGGIMLRASASTGVLPPAVAQIGSTTLLTTGSEPDPQRGGRRVGSEGAYQRVFGGLGSAHA